MIVRREDVSDRVKELVGRGYDDAEIARKLSISTRTVLRHRTALGLVNAKHPEPTSKAIRAGLDNGFSLNQLSALHHTPRARLEAILKATGTTAAPVKSSQAAIRAVMLGSVRSADTKKGLPARRARA